MPNIAFLIWLFWAYFLLCNSFNYYTKNVLQHRPLMQ